MKIRIKHHKRQAGYASVLTVVLVGLISLTLFNVMFSSSMTSQEVVKEATVRQDSQAREEAFLDALIAIVAERAEETMSASTNTANLTWEQIFKDAISTANLDGSHSLLNYNDPTTGGAMDIVSTLSVSGRNGDPADFSSPTTNLSNFIQSHYVNAAVFTWVQSGAGVALGGNYPVSLTYTNSAQDALYPLISKEKQWGTLAAGAVSLPTSSYPENNIMTAPEGMFKATGESGILIGKRNWWTFGLNIAGTYSKDTAYTPYVISIYELPMQQPISSSSNATIGQHAGASDWSNVNISGTVYGKQLDVQGSQAFDHIASRRDMDLSGYTGTLNNMSLGTNETYDSLFKDQGARELYEINNNASVPISIGQDSGRSAYVSINRGLNFYDLDYDRGAPVSYTGILSETNWDEYSHGASQCAMRVLVKEVVSTINQTPMAIEFSYMTSTGRVHQTYSKTASPITWPVEGTGDGDIFPFHSTSLIDMGRNGLRVYLARIPDFLDSLGLTQDEIDLNDSLLIQMDSSQPNVALPSFPSLSTDMAVVLDDGEDLTDFTNGFSLVTASTLYIADDLNAVEASPPSGSTAPTPFYPPLSLFSPETRYGTSAEERVIDITGQVGNIAPDNNATSQILDFKSGSSESVVPTNITANLYSIDHPDQLPPIYTMNWLITIERVQP